MTNYVLLSLLAFLVYLVDRRLINLLVSGVAAGLGMLTKSPAVLLAPVIVGLTLVELWKATRIESVHLEYFLAVRLASARVVINRSIAIVVILWPAMWVQPIHTLASVFAGR